MTWFNDSYLAMREFTVAGQSTPTGTISTSDGDATITGDGTNFTEWASGDSIQLPDTNWYTILSIASDTSLEITENYGADTSAQTYHMRHIDLPIPIRVHKNSVVQSVTSLTLLGNKYYPSPNLEAWQGCTSDGRYLYLSSSSYLRKREMDGVTVVANNANTLTGGTAMLQTNSVYIHTDGRLYLGANNWDTDDPKLGYIRVYDAETLEYIEEHQVENQWCEGCCWDDSTECWWVVYHLHQYVSMYNASWEYQATYALAAGSNPGSVLRIGNFIYTPIHDEAYIRVHEWTGSAMTYIRDVTPPGLGGSAQGIGHVRGTDMMWVADRVSGTPASFAKLYEMLPPPEGLHIGTNVRDDFFDVEFTDTISETTALKKWARYDVGYSSGNYIVIWVKFPIVEEYGTNTIYRIYNNYADQASDTSTPTNCFTLYKDFIADDGPLEDGWTVAQDVAENYIGYTISNQLRLYATDTGAYGEGIYRAHGLTAGRYFVETRGQFTNLSATEYTQLKFFGDGTNEHGGFMVNDVDFDYLDSSGWVKFYDYTPASWYRFLIEYNFDSKKYTYQFNPTALGSHSWETRKTDATPYNSATTNKISFGLIGLDWESQYFDYILISKSAYRMPLITGVGAETEKAGRRIFIMSS